MVKGWFIGNFSPSIVQSKDVEAAVKIYKAGEYESEHYHKVATEITVIVSGTVQMMGKEHGCGDILLIEPGETTDFLALTDTVTVVLKLPSVRNDKYLVDLED